MKNSVDHDSKTNQLVSRFNYVLIHELSKGSYIEERIKGLFDSTKIKYVTDNDLHLNDFVTNHEYISGKDQLLIRPYGKKFISRCSGFKPELAQFCCQYHVVKICESTIYNCSFYKSQSLNEPKYITIYSDLENIKAELEEMSLTMKGSPIRFGFGEIEDDFLALDPITGFSEIIINIFGEYPYWKLNFRTRTDNVELLTKLKKIKNTSVNFFLNTDLVIENEEHHTPDLQKRLDSARKCIEAGYEVELSIDPMIWYEEWEKDYFNLIELIKKTFTSKEIAFISVGSLYYPRGQKQLMLERFGNESLALKHIEKFQDEENIRYKAKLRLEMLQFVKRQLQSEWSMHGCPIKLLD